MPLCRWSPPTVRRGWSEPGDNREAEARGRQEVGKRGPKGSGRGALIPSAFFFVAAETKKGDPQVARSLIHVRDQEEVFVSA